MTLKKIVDCIKNKKCKICRKNLDDLTNQCIIETLYINIRHRALVALMSCVSAPAGALGVWI